MWHRGLTVRQSVTSSPDTSCCKCNHSYTSVPLHFITLMVLLCLQVQLFGVQTLFLKISGRAVMIYYVILLQLIIGSAIMRVRNYSIYLTKIYKEVKSDQDILF